MKKKLKINLISAKKTESSDLDYWQKQTFQARLEAVEILRKQMYGTPSPRLQRVARVVQQVSG